VTSASAPTPTPVERLRETMASRYPFVVSALDRSRAEFGATWEAELTEMLERVFAETTDLDAAAEGYALFVVDLLRRQRQFEQTGEYAAQTYEQAAAQVYFDEEFMSRQYLPGLLLSHYLWPHHFRQLRFFDSAFVAPFTNAGASAVTEIGIGTGIFSRRLLAAAPQARGKALDISPGSVGFARRHLEAYGLGERIEFEIKDATVDPEPCEWLICVEVLEHLEDPLAFLRALRASLQPGGRAFITTALNAANVDHIYLYRSSDEVLRQLEQAGFALEQGFEATAGPPRAPDVPVPAVVAYVVT